MLQKHRPPLQKYHPKITIKEVQELSIFPKCRISKEEREQAVVVWKRGISIQRSFRDKHEDAMAKPKRP
jgi:hypothetical protein